MRRDVELIYLVLKIVLDKSEKEDDGIVGIDRNHFSDNPDLDFQKELAIEAGLLKIMDPHPEAAYPPEYLPVKVTWKGQCFLDLVEIWQEMLNKETEENGDPTATLHARLALAGFL